MNDYRDYTGGIGVVMTTLQVKDFPGLPLVLTDLQFQPLKALAKSRVVPIEGGFRLYPNIELAIQSLDFQPR